MASSPRRQASIFVNGNQVEATAKNITAAFRQASNELGNMVVGSDKYLDKLEEVKRLDGVLKQHRDAVRGVEQGWNLAKGGLGSFIGVAAGAFTVDALIGYGKELFGVAANMELLEKKARTVFGDTLPQITAEAEKNATAMGLTTSEYISAAAAIQDLLVPMGFQRKEAADISAQLTNLSGALSEWSGGQRTAKEVSEILSKSLLGERDALNSLGIDIKQAEVDAELYARGLEKLTGEQKKQAEATVTLDLILRKSTDAQNAFAEGSDSMARRNAELTARISETRETLANVLIPIFERLLAIAAPIVETFGDIVSGIDGMVHPAESASRALSEQAQKVADLEANINPLISRYEQLTSKSKLTKDEQGELKSIIEKVGETIPFAVTQFDEYGKALGINADKVREFIEVEKAALAIRNQDAIDTYTEALKREANEQERLQKILESGKSVREFGILRQLDNKELKQVADNLNKVTFRVIGLKAELARLSGENLKVPGASIKPENDPIIQQNLTRGTKESEAAAEKKRKAQEKIEEDLKSHLARIQQIVKDNEDEARLASLTRDEAEIERIRLKYQKEIDLVKSKFENEQGVKDAIAAIETQRDAEIQKAKDDKRETQVDAEIEAEQEYQQRIDDAKAKYQEDKAKAEQDLKEFNQEALFTENQLEIQTLDEHYATLLKSAEQYGINTTSLKEAYAKKQADIEKKYADKSAKEQQESLKARLAALQSAFTAFGDFTTGLFDLLGSESEDAAALQKIATLAKIAYDTASAISSLVAAANANPANSVTFGAAGAAQFVAGLAQIIANISQAKKILSSAPTVKTKQKAEGGYLSVTGETDGRRYYAKAITAPPTGMLPGHPVLFNSASGAPVLASERGAEYFVASRDLSNPYVANLVRMIDNITHGGVPQFQEGGQNPAGALDALPAPVATPGADAALMQQILQVLLKLDARLDAGIVALVPDRTITDLNKRFKIIDDASGGFFS